MYLVLRNILAVVAGLILGSLVNMGLVTIGPMIIPLPEGANITTMDGLRESMHHFAPANFLFPFLGHALGTLVGAYVAAKLAGSYASTLAMVIGVLFLLGGIEMVRTVGGPMWFIGADLLLAYIPMAYIGGKLGWRG